MRQEEWTVEAADAYLNEIPKFTSEKHTAEGLRRMLSYLNALPQEERIVHVAGTNGKGSVCSFLDAVLQKAGKRTARFTSPHLVRVTERFSFDGQEADDALFLEAFEAVKASYAHFEQEGLGHPTYFEYLFLMFMWMVRRKKPEYVILETGLGGRLDATNCIEHPALTVITSISLDHMEYLGGTVTQIAGEKAGILKKNMPVVYDDTDAAASAVIRNRAAELSCPAYPISPAVYTDLRREHGGMILMIKEKSQRLFIPFEAEYQAVNACIAYQAARLLAVDGETAAAGIRNAVWRGRMEEIQDGVYLDGAHNEGGIRAFAGAAAEVAARRREESGKDGRIFLLFAAVFGGLRVLSVSLNVVSRLPIISGLNRLAGAVLGGAEGIFFVWIAALLITLFSATAIGELFLNQIENNIWLTWLYDHNMLGSILMGVVKRII